MVWGLEDEKHNWKSFTGDLKERLPWDDYMHYYGEAINKRATEYAPWCIPPWEDKEMSRYIVAKIILEEMQKYTDIKLPELEDDIKANIENYKDVLKKEKWFKGLM